MQKKLRETNPKEETTISKIIESLRELEITEIADNIYANGNVSSLGSKIMDLYKLNLNKKFLKKRLTTLFCEKFIEKNTILIV